MTDRQLSEFAGRLKRIRRTHARGGGFEADGTLGQSFYTKQRRRQRGMPLRPMIFLVVAVVGFKGAALAGLGAADYAARIAALSEGSTLQQAGAFIMQVDPVTQMLADTLSPLIRDFAG